MTDLTHLPASELCALAEKWIEQLEYSKGVHWELRTVAGDTAPGDVFRELVERVKAQDAQDDYDKRVDAFSNKYK